MDQQTENAGTELQNSLGNVACNRACLYALLAKGHQAPTLELAEGLLNGDVHSNTEACVMWVNSGSGIFNDSLTMLKEFAEKNKDLSATNLLESLQKEHVRLFSTEEDQKVFLQEAQYVATEQKEEIELVLKAAFEQDEFISFDKNLPYDHLVNEFGFLGYLCSKEGEAWQEGRIPKAKLWRRKEREFTMAHLEKWGEDFFTRLEEGTEHAVYKAFAILGKVFMRLENGY